MYNFDHNERTLSGKDGSHDTILMLLQNNPLNTDKSFNNMSKKTEPMNGGKKSLDYSYLSEIDKKREFNKKKFTKIV